MTDKLKMLVVDDSYASRMLLSEQFKGEYRVFLAENGKEALQLLQINGDIAVVILDLIMPDCDGFEVLRAMAEDENLRQIPVLAITSSEHTDDLIKALDLGAFDVMKKPVDLRIAAHKIKNALIRCAKEYGDRSDELFRHLIEPIETDEKSGVFNKQTFCRDAKAILDRNAQYRYVIIRWDIDDFKVINDVHGVSEGDRLLKAAGDVMRRNASDNMVYGRWESDHFVICMPLEEFNSTRIMDSISNELNDGTFAFDISIRMGVFVVDNTDIDVALMCDRALLALKSTKNNFSRHIAFYDDSMRQEMLERQQIVSEMKAALENGQFVVYLQPQINYETNTLHGAEALVRWKHPEKNLIPPNKFIPVFEQNGFISQLDRYVWETVCRLQRRWINEGRRIVPVSVNVSRIDICGLRIAEIFTELIEKYMLPPSAIRIEITESAYMDTPVQLISAVDKLRDAGFSVEMDDFGSGYSSLNTLKDVPVDMLKLDMKFIEEGGNASRGGSILSSVVRMSNWLHLPVLAEGVETTDQADYLKSIGCIYMQGYLFAKPMPVEEFEKLMQSEDIEEHYSREYKNDISGAMEFLNASTQATLLFNSFVGGAAIIEYDGRSVDAIRINDKFFDILDTTRERFINENSGKILGGFDEENVSKFKAMLQEAIDTDSEATCDMCCYNLHPNQETWTKARVRLLATNVDKFLFYLSIENISSKMNLLMSNLKMTDQLNSVINTVPGGIVDYEIRKDIGMSILFYNDRMVNQLGFTREEYETLYVSEPIRGVHPDDMEGIISYSRDLLEGYRDMVSFRYRHICKNGNWKWLEVSASVSRRAEDRIFATGIIMDIDAAVSAEQKLFDTNRKLLQQNKLIKAAFDDAPFGMAMYTTEPGGKLGLFSYNRKLFEIMKFRDEKELYNLVEETGFCVRIYEDDYKSLFEEVGRLASEKESRMLFLTNRIVSMDGEVIPVRSFIRHIIEPDIGEYLQFIINMEE